MFGARLIPVFRFSARVSTPRADRLATRGAAGRRGAAYAYRPSVITMARLSNQPPAR